MNDLNIEVIYETKLRSIEKNAEFSRKISDGRVLYTTKKNVITHILEGTGKALVTTGNKLLNIAS